MMCYVAAQRFHCRRRGLSFSTFPRTLQPRQRALCFGMNCEIYGDWRMSKFDFLDLGVVIRMLVVSVGIIDKIGSRNCWVWIADFVVNLF
jgi:hypothetical protein